MFITPKGTIATIPKGLLPIDKNLLPRVRAWDLQIQNLNSCRSKFILLPTLRLVGVMHGDRDSADVA